MTVLSHNNINGYILAGGKSSRMGTDKGLLQFNGRSIIDHVIAQLNPAVNKVVIVSNNSDYRALGLPLIGDVINDAGPAGGIYSALAHSDTQNNFIISCDMPFVTTAAIDFMIAQSNRSEITVPIFKNKIEPLFGLYASEVAPQWKNLMAQNIFKLQVLIDHFKVNRIGVDDNALFDETLFTNINTKDDLTKALNKL